VKDLKDRVIDAFESRIMQLITITDITKLPQWDDAEVIGAYCLIEEYRKLLSKGDVDSV